jgi:hypothetical protein
MISRTAGPFAVIRPSSRKRPQRCAAPERSRSLGLVFSPASTSCRELRDYSIPSLVKCAKTVLSVTRWCRRQPRFPSTYSRIFPKPRSNDELARRRRSRSRGTNRESIDAAAAPAYPSTHTGRPHSGGVRTSLRRSRGTARTRAASARAPQPGRAGGRPRAVRRPAMAPTRGRRPARGGHPAAPGRSPRPPARYERGLLPPGRKGPKVPHRTLCRIRVKLRSTRGGPQRPHGDPSPTGGGRGRGGR